MSVDDRGHPAPAGEPAPFEGASAEDEDAPGSPDPRAPRQVVPGAAAARAPSAVAPAGPGDGADTLTITLKLYATLQHLLPRGTVRNAATVDIRAGASLNDVIDGWRVPRELAHLVLVNGAFVGDVDRDAPDALVAGDVLAIWPPVAGG